MHLEEQRWCQLSASRYIIRTAKMSVPDNAISAEVYRAVQLKQIISTMFCRVASLANYMANNERGREGSRYQ